MSATRTFLGHRAGGRARLSILALSAMVIASLLAGPQTAAAASTCGPLFTSPADDAPNDVQPGGDGSNVDQLDIIKGGIVAEDADTFTTEIKIKDLSKDMPSNATNINWYFIWTYGETTYFGRAKVDIAAPDTVVYTFGTYAAPQFSAIGPTEGAFNEGEGGTVEIKIPKADVGAPPKGDKLTQIYAQSYIGQGVPGGSSLVTPVDRGPKDAESYGTDYAVGDCIGGGGGGGSKSPRPKLTANNKNPELGANVRFTASLGVCKGHAGTKIQLQRKVGSVFKKISSKKLSATCKAKFKVKASFKKATFRSYWKAQDADHAAAGSKPVTIRT